eukprot:CAMPEP_0176420770 /NCGR_PEP_ID=MMETSP0127-20121128/8790_1 /TAXON_ID=938130 /ORGANISM="Platyophrya macrostoma, Strain WH" /LENGTH=284 /DNA_ID=CAMNT_0017801401 /DNA_START=46 /DNA_END=900 /DNA_ORIENTATION=-
MADDDNTTDVRYRPFVLASVRDGSLDDAVSAVSETVKAAGFTLAGVYKATPTSTVIVVTSAEMLQHAAETVRGGFGAVVRIGCTQIGGSVQISYTNPQYMCFTYRMAGDNSALAAKLAQVLGAEKSFGSAKGMSEKRARKYQYKIGMEHFDETETLIKYKTFEEALAKTDAALSAATEIVKVCRVDIPGRNEVLYCCGLQNSTDKYANDAYLMSKIDGEAVKHTPHMPYEVLVAEHKVVALHPRFRIAISFPDLSMVGDGSFMEIMDAPKAILKSLTVAVGGKP